MVFQFIQLQLPLQVLLPQLLEPLLQVLEEPPLQLQVGLHPQLMVLPPLASSKIKFS